MKTKSFVLWCILFFLCIAVLLMTVFIADTMIKIPNAVESGVSAFVAEKTADDGDFPFTVRYDGKNIKIENSAGEEQYSFELEEYLIPESEYKKLTGEGIRVENASDMWALIESYTS